MQNEWRLELDGGVVMTNPDWEQVSVALGSMDGDTRSMVSLELVEEGCLLAGGGNEDKFIVVYFPRSDDRNSLTLTDLVSEGSTMDLIVEGTITGPLPARWCIGRSLMARAFRHFFDTGRIPRDLTWESTK